MSRTTACWRSSAAEAWELVYRAEDLKLGRAVALKFLPEEVGDDPKARERFEREAHAVSSLNHPNICTIYEFDEHEGHPFIVMELLHGKTLRDHLADGRFRLTEPEGLEIAIQIASGLEAAHEKGIIHRDIKPANIFITEKNVAKILDFGVAKQTAKAAAADQNMSRPDRTSTGTLLGTAGYMSPEQVRGEAVDYRSDIFSFGAILYEMMAGQRAFGGDSGVEVMTSILQTGTARSCGKRSERVAGIAKDRTPLSGEEARGALSVGQRFGRRARFT